MNARAIWFAALVTLSAGNSAFVNADDTGVLPEVKTQNGVSYISGGIGSDQVSAMQAAAKDYTLMLTCAARGTGEYLADIKVEILNKAGASILDTVTDGPILLAQLAPGEYRVSAESNGVAQNKTVRVSAHHTVKLNWYWTEGPTGAQ